MSWYNQSYRHSLASRGIRTNFVKVSDVPFITLYHGTRKEHLPSIMKTGLWPSSNLIEQGVFPSEKAKRVSQNVFLTPNEATAMRHAILGPEHQNRMGISVPVTRAGDITPYLEIENPAGEDELVILKVKVPSDFILGYEGESGGDPDEMEIEKDNYEIALPFVPPENIIVLSDPRKKALRQVRGGSFLKNIQIKDRNAPKNVDDYGYILRGMSR